MKYTLKDKELIRNICDFICSNPTYFKMIFCNNNLGKDIFIIYPELQEVVEYMIYEIDFNSSRLKEIIDNINDKSIKSICSYSWNKIYGK